MDEVLGRQRAKLLPPEMTEATSGGASLRVESLTRRFPGGERAAVEGVTFELRPGELLALVGASGSGKTTTLRMIAGYELPDGGGVFVAQADGRSHDITRLPPQRRNFGMVFQHYALFPHMSVEENVAFGLEARGVDKRSRIRRAHAALERVGLAGAGARPIQSLSGGEQQRVALARALVIEPSVLLLDEPLSNLDPTLRQSTREQLRAMLHELRVTAVFVTHDQEDAFAIADRVAMLHHGRLMQIGAPEELYHRPSSIEVARFIGRGALLPATIVNERAHIGLGGITQDAPVASRPDDSSMPMLAVLRPECVRLVEPGEAAAWRGRVRSRRFAGGHFVYIVDVAGLEGTSLEVLEESARYEEGAEVGVSLASRPIALVQG